MLTLLASVLCAMLAAWLAHRELQRARIAAHQAETGDSVAVVVARTDLAAGTTLNADNLSVRPVPARYLPARVVTPAQFETVDGRLLAHAMRGGQPLTGALLQPRKARPSTLAARLHGDQSAMSFAVDEVNGLSGLLHPGDRVDLLVTLGGSAQQRSFRLLRDARVLATGSAIDGAPEFPGRGYATITLAVPLAQDRLLALARSEGKVSVLLRPADEGGAGERGPAHPQLLAQWLAGRIPQAPPPRRAAGIPVLYGDGQAAASASPPSTAGVQAAASALRAVDGPMAAATAAAAATEHAAAASYGRQP